MWAVESLETGSAERALFVLDNEVLLSRDSRSLAGFHGPSSVRGFVAPAAKSSCTQPAHVLRFVCVLFVFVSVRVSVSLF